MYGIGVVVSGAFDMHALHTTNQASVDRSAVYFEVFDDWCYDTTIILILMVYR